MTRNHAWIPAYFGIRIGSALVLLKLSAAWLPVAAFANFAQFLVFAAFLNIAVLAGAQNGLIRQSAAAADNRALAEVFGAGFAIWSAAIVAVGLPAALFNGQISYVLTGSPEHGPVVLGLAALSLAAGPGQICWSVLSGRKRVAQSLGAQSFGTLAGTAGSAWFIVKGDYSAAALAFALGPVVATVAALPFAARLRLGWRPSISGIRPLLGYSAAIASTATFAALTLFALRWVYRDQFGASELGYWLAANRISDMSTQLLALFMLQAFVPAIATIEDRQDRTRLMLRYGLGAATLTGAALLVFLLFAEPLVRLFLSTAYLPAIPGITLYMAGDFFRVWVSIAMFAAFASGKPLHYAVIEIATLTIMAVLTMALIAVGEVRSPQIAYAVAYGISALAIGMISYSRRRQAGDVAPAF